MKAKEYAEKYKDLGNHEVSNNYKLSLKRETELTNDMLAEMLELAKERNISTLQGLNSLAAEMNEKGNEISELLNGVLPDNWFSILFKDISNIMLKSIQQNGSHRFSIEIVEK